MKKSSVVLFSLRIFFYLGVAALPAFHPGISVSYDRVGFIQWFLIVPFGALVAFLPVRGKAGGKVPVKFLLA
ncbi:MAG: hypothetical protein LBG42_04750, partial [Treponema sp.]|nr:hypothetical protein [Treponema sp.]